MRPPATTEPHRGLGPDQPVRVLWLIKGLGPGGAEHLLVNQARVHDPRRIDLAAAYLVPWKQHLVAPLAEAGVGAVCLHGPREWDLRWAARLRRLLVECRVEVVHVHSPYVAAVTRLVLRTIPPRARPALVYTEHNRWPRHDRLTRAANRVTFGLDDVDLAVSADVIATMTARARARTEVLVHGIDVPALAVRAAERSEARAELGLDDDDVAIVTVANLRREKAYDVWLEAAADLFERHPDSPVRLLSVGQGPLADDLADHHRRLGLDDRVRLLGYQPDPARVLAAADIFCLASRHEGLPVSLMEALAVGLPVVATEVGGIPEAVTNGVEAVLVPADEPGALASAWASLAADPRRRAAMGDAARRRADAFDAGRTQHHLEDLYCELGAARRARRRS